MGLSIHYSGRIKAAESLPFLIEEVSDICKVYDWKFDIYETQFPNNTLENRLCFNQIFGISFTPTNSETISLAFLSNGVMVCPARLLFFADSQDETERSYVFYNSVKTQYAGVEMHQLIIHIFKYLNDKYFDDFQLQDESGYWETGDEGLMRKKFNEYDALIDNFALSIQTFPLKPGESLTSYFERMIRHVDSLKKR